MTAKIEEYLLAPSKIKDTEVLQVASHIFGKFFASVNEIKEFVEVLRPQNASGVVEPQESCDPQESCNISALMADNYDWT